MDSVGFIERVWGLGPYGCQGFGFWSAGARV